MTIKGTLGCGSETGHIYIIQLTFSEETSRTR